MHHSPKGPVRLEDVVELGALYEARAADHRARLWRWRLAAAALAFVLLVVLIAL